jgi:hypothetical protein
LVAVFEMAGIEDEFNTFLKLKHGDHLLRKQINRVQCTPGICSGSDYEALNRQFGK